MNITAAVVETAGGPFVLQQIEIGQIRPDEWLVSIAASGVCHTDLVVRDQWYPVPLPAVPGHEGAEVVEPVWCSTRCAMAAGQVPRGPYRRDIRLRLDRSGGP